MALIIMGVALCAAGCSSKIDDYCNKVVPCEGGNDKDKDACKDALNGEEDAADDYGCQDQFDAVIDCELNNGTCQTSTGTSSNYYTTVDQTTGTDKCASQQTALSGCTKGASGLHSSTSATTN